MKHCTQCGTKVNSDAKFCQNCGAGLDSSNNKCIDANVKVDLTNKTTEKIINNVSTGLSSSATGLKKISIIFIRFLWRAIKIIAVIAIVGLVIFQSYKFIKNKNDATERQTKIKNTKTRNNEWVVYGDVDPASKKNIARLASIASEDGICELKVQKRITGEELTGLDCPTVELPFNASLIDINVKFDTNELTQKLDIEKYSDSDRIYIPSSAFVFSGYMSYEDFMKGLVTAKAIAIKLPTDDDKWVRFSLNGCSKAIGMLGKEIE